MTCFSWTFFIFISHVLGSNCTKIDEHGHLVVKDSHIKGAGRGLFAFEDICANATIAEYVGQDKTFMESWRTPRHKRAYMVWVNMNLHIDAIDSFECAARYVNDISLSDPSQINARLVRINNRVYVNALRPISKGEEIYASYGDSYWDQGTCETTTLFLSVFGTFI